MRDFSRSDVLDMIDEVEGALHILASVPRAELTNLIAYVLVGSRNS